MRVYNFILGTPFATALDEVVSLVHLKCHNVHDESVTISIDLARAKKIHKALQ